MNLIRRIQIIKQRLQGLSLYIAQQQTQRLPQSPYKARRTYELQQFTKAREILTQRPDLDHKEITRGPAGYKALQQQETEVVIAELDSVKTTAERVVELTQHLREINEPAYRQWLRDSDPGAYRDEYGKRPKRPRRPKRPKTVVQHKGERLTAVTPEAELIARAQQVMGDHYQAPAERLFEFRD